MSENVRFFQQLICVEMKQSIQHVSGHLATSHTLGGTLYPSQTRHGRMHILHFHALHIHITCSVQSNVCRFGSPPKLSIFHHLELVQASAIQHPSATTPSQIVLMLPVTSTM